MEDEVAEAAKRGCIFISFEKRLIMRPGLAPIENHCNNYQWKQCITSRTHALDLVS